MAERDALLLSTFNFRIALRRSPQAVGGAARDPEAQEGDLLGEGGFQECTGLSIELDVAELQEGGRNDGVIRRVGRAKYQPVVLKRGMFVPRPNAQAQAQPAAAPEKVNGDLWAWLQGIASGVVPVARYDGTIEVLDNRGERDEQEAVVLATWTFVRGLPAKVSGPQLNAKTGEIALEELTIHHEGLRFE